MADQARKKGFMAHQGQDIEFRHLRQFTQKPSLSLAQVPAGFEPIPVAHGKALRRGLLQAQQGLRSATVGTADPPGGHVTAFHEPLHGRTGLLPALGGQRPLRIGTLGVFRNAVTNEKDGDHRSSVAARSDLLKTWKNTSRFHPNPMRE